MFTGIKYILTAIAVILVTDISGLVCNAASAFQDNLPQSTSLADIESGQVEDAIDDSENGPIVHGTAGSATATATVPTASASAATMGVFAPSVTWPFNMVHLALLPDGRVMTFGTDPTGMHQNTYHYDVWDPSLGTDANSHTILPNVTGTNIFCASQSLLGSTGEVLINGGSTGPDLSIPQSTLFNPASNTLSNPMTNMTYPRWYTSLLALPDGELMTFGGRSNNSSMEGTGISTPAITPEKYNLGTGWSVMPGATSTDFFGVPVHNNTDWYYPRVAVIPGGNVLGVASDGRLYQFTTSGSGTIAPIHLSAGPGSRTLPFVPFAPGKFLSVRMRLVKVIDMTQPTPVITDTDNLDQIRYWSNGTVLADGKVLVTGGSAKPIKLIGVDYTAEIWDPATGHWTQGADAKVPRLYHSNSLLLTDGTILTGGGGTPGPVTNLNAEIYYPPYLFAADGTPAVRPVLTSTPAIIHAGDSLTGVVGTSDSIKRVTFMRLGSSTHATNTDQRFLDLPFTQTGQSIAATTPADPTVMVTGYYMMFVFNQNGTPSLAKVVDVKLAGDTNFYAATNRTE